MYVFIVNGAAGGGRAAKVRPTIERFMAVGRIDFRIDQTVSPDEGAEMARKAATGGHIPVAVGGDGSVHHVFRGVIDAARSNGVDPKMGILPVGTGNDLARMLRIPLVPEDALSTLIADAVRAVDYGLVEWDGPSGGGVRPFINVAGIGLDAQSALLAVKLKPFIGNLCYSIAPALTVWTWKPCEARIEVDAPTGSLERISGAIYLASVANGRWVGGGIEISPDARIDDGLLDLCLIRGATPLRAIRILLKAVKGRHSRMREVEERKFRSMSISVSREVPIHLDGEPCTLDAASAKFSASPVPVRIVAPT